MFCNLFFFHVSGFSTHFPDAAFAGATFRKHAARFGFGGPATDLHIVGSNVRNLVGMVMYFFELVSMNDCDQAAPAQRTPAPPRRLQHSTATQNLTQTVHLLQF